MTEIIFFNRIYHDIGTVHVCTSFDNIKFKKQTAISNVNW